MRCRALVLHLVPAALVQGGFAHYLLVENPFVQCGDNGPDSRAVRDGAVATRNAVHVVMFEVARGSEEAPLNRVRRRFGAPLAPVLGSFARGAAAGDPRVRHQLAVTNRSRRPRWRSPRIRQRPGRHNDFAKACPEKSAACITVTTASRHSAHEDSCRTRSCQS